MLAGGSVALATHLPGTGPGDDSTPTPDTTAPPVPPTTVVPPHPFGYENDEVSQCRSLQRCVQIAENHGMTLWVETVTGRVVVGFPEIDGSQDMIGLRTGSGQMVLISLESVAVVSDQPLP